MMLFLRDFLTLFGRSDAGQLKQQPDVMITVQFGHWALTFLSVYLLVDLGVPTFAAILMAATLWAAKQFVMDWWCGQRTPAVLWDSMVDTIFHVLGAGCAGIALEVGVLAALLLGFATLFGYYVNYRIALISGPS